MTNTALGAGAEKAQEIIFISEAHEKFYYEKLKEVRYQDVYHKALCYCLGINDDCLQVQEQAEQRMELLTGQMAKSEGVNEELKAANQMSWVAKMNNIRHSAEEIVLTELIYI